MQVHTRILVPGSKLCIKGGYVSETLLKLLNVILPALLQQMIFTNKLKTVKAFAGSILSTLSIFHLSQYI